MRKALWSTAQGVPIRSGRYAGLGKSFVFYAVVSSVVALVAGAAGASLAVILMASLVVPPFLLLLVRIVRMKLT